MPCVVADWHVIVHHVQDKFSCAIRRWRAAPWSTGACAWWTRRCLSPCRSARRSRTAARMCWRCARARPTCALLGRACGFMLGRAWVAVFLASVQKGGGTALGKPVLWLARSGAFSWGWVLLLACSLIGTDLLWQAGAAHQDGGRFHDHRHQACRDEPRVHARRLGAGGREHRDVWRDRGGHAGARLSRAHAVPMPCSTCMVCFLRDSTPQLAGALF